MTKGVQTSEFFPEIGKINYEGRESDHIFSYKFYDEDRVVGNKTMKEHLRFAVAYWHSFCNENSDPFGSGTRDFPWNTSKDPMDNAKYKLEAAFEFFTKLGVPYYCFHDVDIAPEGDTVSKSEKNLQEIVEMAKSYQKSTGVKLLWGTANLFSNPRYMNGASTNPDFEVVCHAGAQVKAALEATVELGGENYVFWGGREGYAALINTNMKRELDHMGHFLRMARDYGRKIGFKGNYLIEPKPAEPSKHQYDFDSATVIGFLRSQGLADDFKINVEQNHAILAGHSFAHDLQTASDAGMLGSIDANMGDVQNGWDTDYFPTDLYDSIHAMMIVLQQGGIAPGGLNFDAKVRRTSSDLEDLFIAHIAGMDTFARGLLIAHDIMENSNFLKMKEDRYASFDSGKGAEYEAGKLKLEDLRNLAEQQGEPKKTSGKIELYETIINNYIK
ncbi:xylose isomerase [Catalinimonas alkaloidigena]|uniref:xylose isomerase n=1 Tax=Catalinimonas alkaloidigena TaxID=1075417 RepID=UPI002404C5DB|nr:xylose isomerase [Catalinimonas alkaloidigena]MDF9800109.1 xylose isomerase [Catalinimonas alkaloidigena]